jgi:hypothetical protein
MSNVRERLQAYRQDPALELCEVEREELAQISIDDLPVGRPVRVEVVHAEPRGVLITRELSRRQDDRLVLLVDVYSRGRYWSAAYPLRRYFRELLRAIGAREVEGRDVLLMASRSEPRREQAHLAYLVIGPEGGSVMETYDAMTALEDQLRSAAARAAGA